MPMVARIHLVNCSYTMFVDMALHDIIDGESVHHPPALHHEVKYYGLDMFVNAFFFCYFSQ